VLAVGLPFAAVVPIYRSRSRPNVREAWTFLAAGGAFVAVAASVPAVLDGGRLTATAGVSYLGVPLALAIDPFGALFGLLAATLWPVASLYSVGYVRGLGAHAQTRYFAAFAASVGSTLGVAFAANLLTLFVFYELLTVATYPLVVHEESPAARDAAAKYVAYTLSGGAALLAGTVLLYAAVGSVSFVPGGLDGLGADPALARGAFALLIVGFGVKAAVVPLHGWLPSAMVAPTPVSGLLHAVAVVKSGAFGVGRVFMYLYGPDAVRDLGVAAPVVGAAALTMLVGGVLALRAESIKGALAYSTVSQLSYIVLGFALAAPTAAFGALLHIPAHAFMKIALFFAAGVVYVETGAKSIAALRGLARRLPVTMAAFAVAAAGLAGVPPVAGFVSKWYLVVGALRSEIPLAAAAFLLAGTLKLLLFWPMIAAAFFGATPRSLGPPGADVDGNSAGAVPDGGDHAGGDASDESARGAWTDERSPALVVPVVLAVAGAVLLGLVPDRLPLWELARAVVAEVFA
jgi:NADH-quinone oxidoreductase subunit L/multicomponent Na+:H+ antiporter subunit D